MYVSKNRCACSTATRLPSHGSPVRMTRYIRRSTHDGLPLCQYTYIFSFLSVNTDLRLAFRAVLGFLRDIFPSSSSPPSPSTHREEAETLKLFQLKCCRSFLASHKYSLIVAAPMQRVNVFELPREGNAGIKQTGKLYFPCPRETLLIAR